LSITSPFSFLHTSLAQALEDGYTTFNDPSYQGSTLVFSTEMSTNDILPYERSVIFVSRKTYEYSDLPIAIGMGNSCATFDGLALNM
jgi:hypothetical protein